MRLNIKITDSTEPGTGVQYHTVATVDAVEYFKNVVGLDDEEITLEKEMEIRQWTGSGRTWECGSEYFDLETGALFELEAVVRKSVWCSTMPAEEAPIRLQFRSERFGELEYDPNSPDEDPTERFRERYRPKNRGPL